MIVLTPRGSVCPPTPAIELTEPTITTGLLLGCWQEEGATSFKWIEVQKSTETVPAAFRDRGTKRDETVEGAALPLPKVDIYHPPGLIEAQSDAKTDKAWRGGGGLLWARTAASCRRDGQSRLAWERGERQRAQLPPKATRASRLATSLLLS